VGQPSYQVVEAAVSSAGIRFGAHR